MRGRAAGAGRGRRRRPPRSGRRARGPGAADGSRSMIRRPKLRSVNSPMAAGRPRRRRRGRRRTGSPAAGPSRKLQKPAARPRMAIAKRSRMRSMKTVPNVRLSETVAVDLEQVGAVDVAELGRHEAVDEPREEDDLGRVADADREARAAQQERPALAAQREADIEDERRPPAASTGLASSDERRDLDERCDVERREERTMMTSGMSDRDDRPRLSAAGARATSCSA